MKYLRTAVIEAHQWAPTDQRAAGRVLAWLFATGEPLTLTTSGPTSMLTLTLEGEEPLVAVPGDWLVRTEQGDLCVMSAADFAATYAPAAVTTPRRGGRGVVNIVSGVSAESIIQTGDMSGSLSF